MFVLLAYDIANDRRRSALVKVLEAYGDRVQESVFECSLTQATLRELLRQAEPILDRTRDSLRIYRLCVACLGKVAVHGLAPAGPPPAALIV
jgi:CRISPR-associated protein Cas2